MSGDSFDEMSQYTLLAVILACLLTTPAVLIWAGVVAANRMRRHRPWRGTALRALAGLAAGAAIIFYAWGGVHLIADESAAYERCQQAVPAAYASGGFTYEVSFIPLRGQCRVAGVGTFEPPALPRQLNGRVPGYVNPTVAVAGGLALAFLIAARRFPDGDGSIEPDNPASVTEQKG